MVKEFCLAWEKNKSKLEDYFKVAKNSEYMEYKDIVKLLFDIVINPEMSSDYLKFNTENIVCLDDGDYQGTQVFILHRNTYQPFVDDYVYTNECYGSCPGCDILERIIYCSSDNDNVATENGVKDLMTLCLHLMQRCNYMRDVVEET